MRSILNDGDRDEIATRLRSLSVSSTRRWGQMDVAGMLQHLQLTRMGLANAENNERQFESLRSRTFEQLCRCQLEVESK